MTNCLWEKIAAFSTPGEFDRFVHWIETQVENGECEEFDISENIQTVGQDRRFKCKESGQIWKLSHPDPGYFPGSWLPE